MKPQKYKMKPVTVEAMQLNPGDTSEITQWIESHGGFCSNRRDALVIGTLEGPLEASINDFIIKGVQGEFYACKPDIFEQTYELVQGQGHQQQQDVPEDYPLPVDRILDSGVTEHGYVWVAAKAPNYGVNGYIRIPDTIEYHPWQKDELFDVYGDYWVETFRQGRWHGFDTQHHLDAWSEEYIWSEPKERYIAQASSYGNPDAHYYSAAEVVHLAKSMAVQAHTDWVELGKQAQKEDQ